MEKKLTFENLESEKNLTHKVIEAIKSNNVETLFNILADIDQQLTGYRLGAHGCGEGLSQLKKELEEFFKEVNELKYHANIVFYLGDSGISRLIIDAKGEKIKIFLTSNSSNEVKQKFEELVDDVGLEPTTPSV